MKKIIAILSFLGLIYTQASMASTHGLGVEFINLSGQPLKLLQANDIHGKWKSGHTPIPGLTVNQDYTVTAEQHYSTFSSTEIEFEIAYGLDNNHVCGAHVERDKSIISWSPAYFRTKIDKAFECKFIARNTGNLQIVIEPYHG